MGGQWDACLWLFKDGRQNYYFKSSTGERKTVSSQATAQPWACSAHVTCCLCARQIRVHSDYGCLQRSVTHAWHSFHPPSFSAPMLSWLPFKCLGNIIQGLLLKHGHIRWWKAYTYRTEILLHTLLKIVCSHSWLKHFQTGFCFFLKGFFTQLRLWTDQLIHTNYVQY